MEEANGILMSEAKRPTRGRGGTKNFPNAKMIIETDEDKALVSKLLKEVLTEYRKPKVKNDEELVQRLDEYFAHCAETGQIPTIEEMSLSTGYDDRTLWNWETGRRGGFSDFTGEIIKKAKYFCKAFDAKLVISGKLNFLAYCFRAKNYYGMVDKQEVVLTPNQSPEEYSVEQIRQQYLPESSDFALTDSATIGNTLIEENNSAEGSSDF